MGVASIQGTEVYAVFDNDLGVQEERFALWRIGWDNELTKAGKTGFYNKITNFRSTLL